MLKSKNKFLLVFFLITSNIFSQTEIGKYSGEFLSLGVGGRALGMGGASVAVADDITAGYWNPAGLAHMNYPQISLMHEEHFGSLVNYNYAAVAIPYGKDMSFGISAIRLSIDGIYDTRDAGVDKVTGEVINFNDPNWQLLHPNWGLDRTKITEFSNTDWAFFLTFAKRHSEKFYWGANVKFIRRDIAEFAATGIGFDVGAVYMPYENFSLGANFMDVTTTLLAWDTGRNELISPTAKIGTAYKFNFLGGAITPALDLDIRFENRQTASVFNLGPVSFDPRIGMEYNFKNIVALRGGYNDVKQFTIGAGVKLPKLNIDYTFATFNESKINSLPETHRISLILTIEEPKFLRKSE
ncbi:MAG: PorV/PorQ family protein [Ignavibacteriae bacterium]|nr:PorV/PorQ family protein [Ignavibacteriota bacterium]